MKKFILLFLIITASKATAQIVFCPPGAEWHYSFSFAFSPNHYNESIKYVGDSIDGIDTSKILSHKRFFSECNSPVPTKTLIKQKGDTVFLKNSRTQNTWQILYNFACGVGDTWYTQILLTNNSSGNFFHTVTAVNQVTVNGFTLRSLSVKENNSLNSIVTNFTITERFGCSGFLFNYHDYDEPSCDADFFERNLCYQDSSFGLKQFSSLPCNYAYYVGIADLDARKNSLKLFPNPTSNFLNLKFENKNEGENYDIRFVNILGMEFLLKQKIKSDDENCVIDLSAIEQGIYFVKVFEEGKLITTQKIIKN